MRLRRVMPKASDAVQPQPQHPGCLKHGSTRALFTNCWWLIEPETHWKQFLAQRQLRARTDALVAVSPLPQPFLKDRCLYDSKKTRDAPANVSPESHSESNHCATRRQPLHSLIDRMTGEELGSTSAVYAIGVRKSAL